MMRLLPFVGVLLFLPGCAARAGYFLLDAARTVQDARDADAETRAIYEYTLAEEYLKKAREEDGYSDYQAAEELARRAREEALRAAETAAERGVAPADVEGMSDEARRNPPPSTPATPVPDVDIDP